MNIEQIMEAAKSLTKEERQSLLNVLQKPDPVDEIAKLKRAYEQAERQGDTATAMTLLDQIRTLQATPEGRAQQIQELNLAYQSAQKLEQRIAIKNRLRALEQENGG